MWWSIGICLAFCFLFSGIEIAFLASDKLHIELQRKRGRWDARLLAQLMYKPTQFLSTLLIGNTLALVYYGYVMAAWMNPWLNDHLPWLAQHKALLLLSQSVLSTAIVLVLAEFTPKNLFLIRPNLFLSLLALPAYTLYVLFYPVVQVVSAFAAFFIRNLLQLPYEEQKKRFRLSDLSAYVQNLAQKGKEQEVVNRRFFYNALDFKEVRLRHCMVPRTEIEAVEVKQPAKALRARFLESGHSRILVYKDSIDHVIGYYSYAMLIAHPQASSSTASIATLQKTIPVHSIPIAPETASAKDVLLHVIEEKKSIALVVDEYGGTAGIVTIEDMIEEIFGEIHDEHDEIDNVEKTLGEGKYQFSARLEIDYLNETYQLGLPVGEYDTLGGLVLSVSERIPDKEDVIRLKGFALRILSIKKARIGLVELTCLANEKSE